MGVIQEEVRFPPRASRRIFQLFDSPQVKKMFEGFGKHPLIANLGYGAQVALFLPAPVRPRPALTAPASRAQKQHDPEKMGAFVDAVHEASSAVYAKE